MILCPPNTAYVHIRKNQRVEPKSLSLPRASSITNPYKVRFIPQDVPKVYTMHTKGILCIYAGFGCPS
jgi:hypothetical protein